MNKTPLRQLRDIMQKTSPTIASVRKSRACFGFFSNGQVYLNLNGALCEKTSIEDYLIKLQSMIRQITAPDTFLVPGDVHLIDLKSNHVDFWFHRIGFHIRISASQIIWLG